MVAIRVLLGCIALLGCSPADSREAPAMQAAQPPQHEEASSGSVRDTSRAVAFLDYMRSTVRTTQGVFDTSKGGAWDVDSVLSYISADGVEVFDVNTGPDSLYTIALLREELVNREGSAFTRFVHLGFVLALPPQYSALSFSNDGEDVVVDVTFIYRLRFRLEDGRLQLVRLEHRRYRDV